MSSESALWRKSSRSMNNGNCAEIGNWRKSVFSAGGNCAEVGNSVTVVGVRDTKQSAAGDARTVLEFPASAWREFTQRIAAAG